MRRCAAYAASGFFILPSHGDAGRPAARPGLLGADAGGQLHNDVMMSAMYEITIVLHSLLRWLVIALGLLAVLRAISGVSGRRPWTPSDDRAGRLFVIGVDTQMLVGLILYGLLSPITYTAFADMGAAMKDATLRFYAVEHLVIMLGAIALVHIGRSRLRKAHGDGARPRPAAIFFRLGVLLLRVGTPWRVRAMGRPLLPSF
jgi:hypothetical protein